MSYSLALIWNVQLIWLSFSSKYNLIDLKGVANNITINRSYFSSTKNLWTQNISEKLLSWASFTKFEKSSAISYSFYLEGEIGEKWPSFCDLLELSSFYERRFLCCNLHRRLYFTVWLFHLLDIHHLHITSITFNLFNLVLDFFSPSWILFKMFSLLKSQWRKRNV